MKIGVFLASKLGNAPMYEEEAVNLGKWIAANGHSLVFGGSREGLMEKLAKTVMESGAETYGVQTKLLNRKYGAVDGLTQLELTDRMHERIRRMIDWGDIFVILPGGVGTLEEATVILSMNKLGMLGKPVYFDNLGGYYEPLKWQFALMKREGFGDAADESMVHFINSYKELDDIVKQ